MEKLDHGDPGALWAALLFPVTCTQGTREDSTRRIAEDPERTALVPRLTQAPGNCVVPQVGRCPEWVPWVLSDELIYKRKESSETWDRERRKWVKLNLNGNLMFIWICSSYAWNGWYIWIFKFRPVLCENALIIPKKTMPRGNEVGKVGFIIFSFSLNPFNYDTSLHL